MIERTLVVIKPDGVYRSLIGEVIKRFEQRGLKVVGMKMLWAEKDFAGKHYTEDIEKKYGKKVREMLLNYITEGPVVAFVLEGVQAVSNVRKIVGSTYPHEAPVGTIRGDFCHGLNSEYCVKEEKHDKNVVHASGNVEEAEIEIGLWFSESELFDYKNVHQDHVRGEGIPKKE